MLVIANLHNFTFAHDIFVTDDNNHIIASRKSSMKNMNENILELCRQNKCWNITLMGNKKYANKIAKDLEELGLSKYTNENITINVISQ